MFISEDGKGVASWSKSEIKKDSYLLIPSNIEIVDSIIGLRVQGFVLDEDIGNDELEIVLSKLDEKLKMTGIRYHYDVLAKSSKIRHPADVFKLVLLGADSVIISALENALGYNGLNEKAFNIISGMKKEIALLAGAAGVYSLQSTLTGNRELLRSLNLDSNAREKLRVKPAGAL